MRYPWLHNRKLQTGVNQKSEARHCCLLLCNNLRQITEEIRIFVSDINEHNFFIYNKYVLAQLQLLRGVEWVHGLFLFPLVLGKGKSILQVPDTGTRVLHNTRPFLCSSIVSFWITPAHSKERRYHIFRQYWNTKDAPVFTNTGTFQYLGLEVYSSHFLVTREKLQKLLQHISHSHTYTYFAHPIDFLCFTNFEKSTNLSGTVSLWYESWCWFLFAPFWNNQ